MFGWFKRNNARKRVVLLVSSTGNLYKATAAKCDSGWMAYDPWGEIQLLQDDGTTTGNSRIARWMPHTGWEVEAFLQRVDG